MHRKDNVFAKRRMSAIAGLSRLSGNVQGMVTGRLIPDQGTGLGHFLSTAAGESRRCGEQLVRQHRPCGRQGGPEAEKDEGEGLPFQPEIMSA